jgi:hypothetical protein
MSNSLRRLSSSGKVLAEAEGWSVSGSRPNASCSSSDSSDSDGADGPSLVAFRGGILTGSVAKCTEEVDEDGVLPALPLRTPTADHAHFANLPTNAGGFSPRCAPLHRNAIGTAGHHSQEAQPTVFQYPLPQTVSREAKHVKNMLRIFGSVDSIQHSVAAGKNSGYINSTQVNCDPRAVHTPSSVKHSGLPHLPLTILLNPGRGGLSNPRGVGESTPADSPRTTDYMELSFRGTPRTPGVRTVTPRGFTSDTSASTFFRINTPREPPRPPGTATGLGGVSSLDHRGRPGGSPPHRATSSRDGMNSRGSVVSTSARRPSVRVMPNAPVPGDDVILCERDFVRAETRNFEKITLPEAKLHQANISKGNSLTGPTTVPTRSPENGNCALLRMLFHTKIAFECDTAKKISAMGKADMPKLVTDVRIAMNKLGLRQLDNLDFQTFLCTLLNDPSVPPSDARILFALIDGNGSNQIDVNELAEGLELLAMTDDQIILSFCQKLFAEPNKYRNVRLSYQEVISIFRCVLAFYEANGDVGELMRKAEDQEKRRPIAETDAISVEPASPLTSSAQPDPPSRPGLATLQTETGHLGVAGKKSGFAGGSRLARPTIDTVRRRLESEVAAVVGQVWRFSSNKGGQIHVPLLRTLMAADGALLVQACQALPSSLKRSDSRLLKEVLKKELATYEERLAAITNEADAMILSVKDMKGPVKKPNSTFSGMSDDTRKAALEQEKKLKRAEALQAMDSYLLKPRPMPYDEIAQIYDRYEMDGVPPPRAPQQPPPLQQQQQQQQEQRSTASPRARKMSLKGGPAGQTGRPATVGASESAEAASAKLPAGTVELQHLPTDIMTPVSDNGEHTHHTLARKATQALLNVNSEVAADPWHPRFTADIFKVNDSERQKLAVEHTQKRYVSEGKIVLQIDANGVRVPIAQFA